MTAVGQLALVHDESAYVAARCRWKAGAARLHYGLCQRCGRIRDESGKLLMVARQERARRFLCFDCFYEGAGRRRGVK